MAIVLAGTRVLLAIARIVPVSPLARRASDILTIHVASTLTGTALTVFLGRQFPLLAFAWPTTTGLLVGLLWAFWLPAASDVRQHSSRAAREGRIDWRAGVADLLGRIGLQSVVKAR
jgi:hypothetical protein